MKLRFGLLLPFALLALFSSLTAQSFLVRTYEEQDGLISSAVNGIAQDDSGRMWFSARNGISIYDGARWTALSSANGLPTVAVHQLRADNRGAIWGIGENPIWQLVRFDRNGPESFPIPFVEGSYLRSTGLAVLAGSGGVRVAMGTADSGVYLFEDSRWTVFSEETGLSGNTINGLAALGDGFLAATNKGLSWIGKTGVENRWKNAAPELRGMIRGLAVEKTPEGEKVWLAGDGWLATLQGETLEFLSRENPMIFSELYPAAVMLPDLQGGLYLGNAIDIHFFSPSTRRYHPLGIMGGLIAEGATALFLDRERNLWIGGLRGVSKISSRRFYNFRKAQGLLEDEVTSIQPLGQRGLAFGHNSGLTIWDGTEFQLIPFPEKPGEGRSDARVLDLAVDDTGVLWVAASSRGLGRWTPAQGLRWFEFNAYPTRTVASVVVDHSGKIWVAAAGVLFQIQKGRPVQVFPEIFHDMFIRKLAVGADGSIFAATGSYGVFRWDGKSWAQFSGAETPGASNVYSAFVDSRGRTLVGTFVGLFEIKGNRLVPFAENGFAINRPVYLILEDNAGRLWFGTDNGVVRWDGKTSRVFSKMEGFSGREVNRSAGMIDARGIVWIGTNSGASAYHEEYDLGPDVIPPPLLSITGLDVNGRPVDFSREITLGYRENNLVFHFLGTSFIDENALRFESYLSGFDSTWGPEYRSAERQIRYTNLRAGSYVFNLRARNAAGSVSETVSSPVIRIRNPFWLSWWFILTAALVGGGLIVSLGLAVTQHRLAERLEVLVLDRTAQIQSALTEKEILLKEIHHRVKNNLQIISSLLFLQSRKIKDPANLGLFQASIGRIRAMALVHENLYRTDRLTSIGMEDYLKQLVQHLIETYGIHKEIVSAAVLAPGITLPLETAITFGLIVNELISNALKHAFPGDRDGEIKILLARASSPGNSGEEEKRPLVLTVSDNGIGIPEEMENGKPDSLGLKLVSNLVSQLDGHVEVKRENGTVFRITFPG